jgi:hypothetical protein
MSNKKSNTPQSVTRHPFLYGLAYSIVGIGFVTLICVQRGVVGKEIVIGWVVVPIIAFGSTYLGVIIGFEKAKKIIGLALLLCFLSAALSWVIWNGGLVVKK